jgi:hemerythrin
MECKTLEAERELTGTLLQELHDYTCYHFVAEEELLQTCNYPGLVEHQSQHQVFLYKLEAMAKVYADGGLAMSFETFVFLRDWIVEHVLNSDAEYVPYVKRLL